MKNAGTKPTGGDPQKPFERPVISAPASSGARNRQHNDALKHASSATAAFTGWLPSNPSWSMGRHLPAMEQLGHPVEGRPPRDRSLRPSQELLHSPDHPA